MRMSDDTRLRIEAAVIATLLTAFLVKTAIDLLS